MFKLIYILSGLISTLPVRDPSTTSALLVNRTAPSILHLAPVLYSPSAQILPDHLGSRRGVANDVLDAPRPVTTSNITVLLNAHDYIANDVASPPAIRSASASATDQLTTTQADGQYTNGALPLRCIGQARISINRIQGDTCISNNVMTHQTLLGFQRLCYGWRRVEIPIPTIIHDPLPLHQCHTMTYTESSRRQLALVSTFDPYTGKLSNGYANPTAFSFVFNAILFAFYAFTIARQQTMDGPTIQGLSQDARANYADTDAGKTSRSAHSITLSVAATVRKLVIVLQRMSHTIVTIRTTVKAQLKEIELLKSQIEAQRTDSAAHVEALQTRFRVATHDMKMAHCQEIKALKETISSHEDRNKGQISQGRTDRAKIADLTRNLQALMDVDQLTPAIKDELHQLRQWKKKTEASHAREIHRLEGELRLAKDGQEQAEAIVATGAALQDGHREEIEKLRSSKEALAAENADRCRAFQDQMAGARYVYRRDLSHVQGKLEAAESRIAAQSTQLVMQEELISSKDTRLAKATEGTARLAATIEGLEWMVAKTRDESHAKIADLQAELREALAKPNEPEVRSARATSGQGEQGRRGVPRSILSSALREIQQQKPAPPSSMRS
ncbi:hypothetical protein FRB94_011971 [Tulasnella sp. JGI-2019a]|nr:hypothetical protein FRB93_012735 [Tulasnella sp. JGI-2019a]KAG9009554.1 hypothetical protein FRB94_011971 [Tulasnella sp. JGI-2019a]